MTNNSDNQYKNNCVVLVSSYDDAHDLWQPFFTLFFRFWPDCPFPVYLISNYQRYEDQRVASILIGKDKGWATNIKRTLKQIHTPYVICMLDDCFLEKMTDTKYINSLIEFMQEKKIGYISLFPTTAPTDGPFPSDLNLVEKSKGFNRVALQAGLWDKNILSGLLKDGETPWDMEIEGSIRSNNIEAPFLTVKEPVVYYNARSAVIRGKWNYNVVKFCRREGIKIKGQRPVDYKRFIATSIDRIRKDSFFRTLHAIPIIGYLGVIALKIVRKITNK